MRSKSGPHRSWDGEKLLTLVELSRELLRNPDAPVKRSHWSLYRWTTEGVAVYGTNRRIKLAHTIMFGARHSSVQAVAELCAKLAKARLS